MTGDPADLTLSDARRALAAGRLSPADLLRACLARLDRTEPVLRAWEAVARNPPAPREGPLFGIPLGVKDVIDAAGLPTTASSRVLDGNVAAADAPAVAALVAAGAVVLGKTRSQEFAYGAVTPPAANPWDPARIPGGSSGGSAVAVAAGHCPAALGTDTAGSIRIPAALCGVSGLKPRPGIVPVEGVIPLAPSLDAVGPLARTAEDLALLWQALTGEAPPPAGGLPPVVVPQPGALPEMQPAVEAAYAEAVEILGRLAGGLGEAEVPPFAAFDAPRARVLMPEALAVHRSRGWWPARASGYTEQTRGYLVHAESLDPADVEAGRRECARLAALLAAAVGDRVLATPTVPIEAPTHAEAALTSEGSPRRPAVMALTRIPGPVNAARLAALSLPCGFTHAGLPVGLHLIGREEWVLLALGAAYERETGWRERRPAICSPA